MRQDIHIRHSDIEDAGDDMVATHEGGVVSVQLGKYFQGMELYMMMDDAETIANRILDAIREARTMRCDLCGVEAKLDGQTYKHLDTDGSGRLWIGCATINNEAPSGQVCHVNGLSYVPYDELAALTVDQLL